MIRLTKEEFLSYKKSNTIFILGSGYSVNSLSDSDWAIVRKFDSIGFNWFCKHRFQPTFYLIREQANNRARTTDIEDPSLLIRAVNNYKKTAGIIADVSSHSPHSYSYTKDKNLSLPCVVVRDNKSLRSSKSMIRSMHRDPFEKTGLIHGNATIVSILHLVYFMKYERIVFLGVDLYDSRYFWLPKNVTRHTVSKKKQVYKDRHAIAKRLLKFIDSYKKLGIDMYTGNPKSLLKNIMPTINLDKMI